MGNIYEMYAANGNASGFWVQRDSWGPRTVALITLVDGKTSGVLRGRAPYYGNPDALCEFYLNGDLNNSSKELPCPGSFCYTQIKQPDFISGLQSSHSIMPTYSDHLIALSRAYDRAVLASRAMSWLINDLESDCPDVLQGNDFDLVPWASKRVSLLEDSLPDMHRALCAQIAQESAPFFEVSLNENGIILEIPPAIDEIIGAYSGEAYPEFKADELSATKCVNEGKAAIRLALDHQVILFEGDWYLFPKTISSDLIEIWWRRFLQDNFGQDRLYSLCLVPNPLYGWDCYGHER